MSWRARMSPSVTNITIFLNPKDPNCFGVRSWLRGNLPELRLLNPATTFNIQELSFGEPTMFVGYNFTDKRLVRLAGATEAETDDIFSSIATYGDNHALADKAHDDGTLQKDYRVINFGFAESMNIKNDGLPYFNNGQINVDGVDDPGQTGRVLARNNGLKLLH